MGLAGVAAFLRQHGRIAIDTNVFIYELEENPRYVSLTREIFQWVQMAGHAAVTSTITLTEVLVQPYRDGDQRLIQQYYALLATYPNLEWVALDFEIAALAARIRATHGLRTPDALQAACAMRASATGLVTNDPIFRRVTAFHTLVLEDVLK